MSAITAEQEAIPKPMNVLTGQNEYNGTAILDVTDPKHPVYLAHIPGQTGLEDAGGGQMVRVCDGKSLPKGDPKAVYLLRPFWFGSPGNFGTHPDPAHPKLVTRLLEHLTSTHKSWWECDTGIAYVVASSEGWRARHIIRIYDLSDPAHPVFIRDFGLIGQQPGANRADAARSAWADFGRRFRQSRLRRLWRRDQRRDADSQTATNC